MVSATSLGQRLRLLEDDLTAVPSRIAVYHDMPFAIFRYDPDEEFAMRAELRLLLTRLQAQHGRKPVTISLADLLWESLADHPRSWLFPSSLLLTTPPAPSRDPLAPDDSRMPPPLLSPQHTAGRTVAMRPAPQPCA